MTMEFKTVVDGYHYDTRRSTRIGVCSMHTAGTVKGRSWAWWVAALYKTKQGRYFLVGRGGPMSRFAHNLRGNKFSELEHFKIEVLTADDAFTWAVKHLDKTAIIEHMGELLDFGDKGDKGKEATA